MENENIYVGLDVGTTKVTAVVGRRGLEGKLEVLASSSVPSLGVVGGKVAKIDKTVAAISDVIDKCEAQLRARSRHAVVKLCKVNVNISGQHIIQSFARHGSIIRSHREEEISSQDLNRLSGDMHKMIMEPGWDILHVYPCGYRVDFEEKITKDPVGMLGSKLEGKFILVCVKEEAMNRLTTCIERVGLRIEQMIIDPMASALSVLSDEEREAGVCLVDIGGATTDVVIFRDGLVHHVVVIPYGASLLTDDLKKGCAIMAGQAEALKVSYGRALVECVPVNEVVSVPGIKGRVPKEFSVRNITAIIQCRMEEIIEAVDEEIIRSGHMEVLGAGVVITGGGACLRELTDLFAYVTGYDTRIGYPNEHVGMPAPSPIKAPGYATAVGLVLASTQVQTPIQERMSSHGRMSSASVGRKQASSFFQKVIQGTKGIFLEDMDDRAN